MDTDAKVIVYGAEWCAFCHTAMHYFDQIGVKYVYKNVDLDQEALRETVTKSGQTAIPVLDIDGEIIVGFNKPAIDAALHKHGLAQSK